MNPSARVKCPRFESQAWRKTLCKNCFKAKNEHLDEELTSDVSRDPEATTSDKITTRKNLRTPSPERQPGSFVGLGRKDSDSSSGGGGRLTPITEEQGRSASAGRTFGEENRNKEAKVVSLGSTGHPPEVLAHAGKIVKGQNEQKPSANETERSSSVQGTGSDSRNPPLFDVRAPASALVFPSGDGDKTRLRSHETERQTPKETGGDKKSDKSTSSPPTDDDPKKKTASSSTAAAATDLGKSSKYAPALNTNGESPLQGRVKSSAAASDRREKTENSNAKIASDPASVAAAAAAAVEPNGNSYVQSLRISLSGSVPDANTKEGELGPVGAKESRNSYGSRHGVGSRQQQQQQQLEAAGEGVGKTEGGGGCCDRRSESGIEGEGKTAASGAASSKTVTQFQSAKATKSGDVSSCRESLSREDHEGPDGLNISDRISGTKVCPSSSSSTSSFSSSPSESPTRRQGSDACLLSEKEKLVNNNNNNNCQSVLISTSDRQLFDAGNSKVCYAVIGSEGTLRSREDNRQNLGDAVTDGRPGSHAAEETLATDRNVGGSLLLTDDPRRKATAPLQPHSFGESRDQNNSSNSSSNQQQPVGGGRQLRRPRVFGFDDDPGTRIMNSFDYKRSDVMMEGSRLVVENLREKVCLLHEQIEKQEREKTAIGDLLAAKKSDYEAMKDHYKGAVDNLETEVQRLKSEKSRLLDKLQLPESERASLAAAENEIAELKRRLDEYENRYAEAVGESEDLRQEVRDLQLEMHEMHDQFREEETIEFRELQKELENSAKNCRILQFKLRKSDRRVEQLESDRNQFEDKMRSYERCFQSSDDKRRIRMLEEDLRLAKESAVRLHVELERAEERSMKRQEELDRAKGSLNEADNNRLCLQNQLDNMKHEMGKLRDQLRFEPRQDAIKTGMRKIGLSENDAQLTKNLKESLEREKCLKEQLKLSQEENVAMRKKLLEKEEETDGMSLQLCKLNTAKSGRQTKGKARNNDKESLKELPTEASEPDVKLLKRKIEELQKENDNLICAIRFLRSKLEQHDGMRIAVSIGDTKSTREILARIGVPGLGESEKSGGEVKDEVAEQLKSCQKEVHCLRERIAELEVANAKLLEDCRKFQPTAGSLLNTTSNRQKDKEKNLMNTSKETNEMISKLEALQKTVNDLQSENDKLKENEKSKPLTVGAKDKEPASWRWEKQELEKQVKEFKKKFEDLQADTKKPASKAKDTLKEDSRQSEESEQYKKQLDELKKKLSDTEELLKKKENEKEKIEKELKAETDKAAREKTDATKAKDFLTKQKDDVAEDKKKLTNELEAEKKKNEELTKQKDRIMKEQDEWKSERKKLIQERDAAVKENEELAKNKTRKDEDLFKISTPFGLRSKGKSLDSGVSDSTRVKELTEALEKKEAELQTLRTKAEAKGPIEKLNFQTKETSELRKEKEQMEKDLNKSQAEKDLLKTEIKGLREKLKTNENVWLTEKAQLEQDLKQVAENNCLKTTGSRAPADPKAIQEKEALIKEKFKLIEEVTKLKKELDKKRNSDREEFGKKLKDKTKSLDESEGISSELQQEIERSKAQVGSVSASPEGSSKAITIPVQQDKFVKSIPIQKISKLSTNSCDEQDPALIKAELYALEETYRSRTKNLEEEISFLREQFSSAQKENRIQSQKSQKSFAELKKSFDKESNSWNKERELLQKSGKLADESSARVSQLNKTVEELNGKLKSEEAKRRELEVKLAAQQTAAAHVDKTISTEEKPKAQEEKTATGQKTSDFRNRFEKFGGTPRPVRKQSLPSISSAALSDTTEKSDWVGEIQRQMTETEKARLKDREELLEKLERQKKDFELKLEAFKETSKMLNTKSQELSALEKKMVELHCQLEEERSVWAEEKSKLQSKLTEAQKSGREEKDKVAELTGEVRKLQARASSGKSGATTSSETSAPVTSAASLATEKPAFKTKSQDTDSTQNSTSGPVTSIVIPIRKVDSAKKPPTEDAAQASAPTTNGVGKPSKKLFPPFATDSTQNINSSTKSYTPGQRTPIPITRINRSNAPKL